MAGGTAIEAMVAAAATIAVVYPHMNGLGGDAFWLIKRKGGTPVTILGGGRAAALATPDWYRARGHTTIPARGGEAALVVPGAIASWQKALDLLPGAARLPLDVLLADALCYARDGFAITCNQAAATSAKAGELANVPGFADVFMPGGRVPDRGARLRQPALAGTIEQLIRYGLDAFYRGALADALALTLEAAGSSLRFQDLSAFEAQYAAPFAVQTSAGTLYNTGPPTQGVASLMILAIFDRLDVARGEGFDHVHGLVEATKQAYRLRNTWLADPDFMAQPASAWLNEARIDALAAAIDRKQALPWPEDSRPGDTIWMGAADKDGTVVSFIQSVFWEFGSGVTCPETGIVFENRGAGFTLLPGPNQLAPGKRPFHTLNPALAELADGRVIAYGAMGGDGQPQTQSALFTRHVQFGQGLQQAVTAPRWLLGTSWGAASTTLKLEGRFDPDLVRALADAGHDVEIVADFSDAMGHAGAVVLHPDGLIEGAGDPRSDGAAIAF
ncbi:gamma-glutamyltransferase [Hyphomicrobium sp.]|uniref:gamma-glutamyltransferase family protein n=1 Tax=Hyphomicrobium sp. TaxID=82 RepID=UPI0025C046BB|nr:gamma-glutamyltransferase [Hyphomicrobium sp.]MCC7250480.1 gamma-glutamyltransferase [Hyphomicrobium sp.]